MALTAQTVQFLSQQGLTREVDASSGPEGPKGVTAYWLVPTSGWINGQRFPHPVEVDFAKQSFDKVTFEGVEYYRVPESSSNLPGLLGHYAQRTGVADLVNPPGGGVNKVRETVKDVAHPTIAPDAVKKYANEQDSLEEARQKVSEEDARVQRQVTVSPAREPAEGKLVHTVNEEDDKSKKSPKPTVGPNQ